MPVEVTKNKLKVGEACWRRKAPVYVSKWNDRREVLMISAKHTYSMVNTLNCRKQVKVKSQVVHDYNIAQIRFYHTTAFKERLSGGIKNLIAHCRVTICVF